MIQAICVPDARYASYLAGSDFIRKHIFPGSSICSVGYIFFDRIVFFFLSPESNILMDDNKKHKTNTSGT